ncbi:MAG: chromate resistance protein [Candidatus Rokubacteria bacterium]|nr:chromate resistance protein [Candidatus Rokubacteria bacterium]
MRWVTREKARVDRIACPWLIARFIDPEPVFRFVPADEVMQVAEGERAIPFDVPGVELGHHGELCSFDAFLAKYRLDDPALRVLAPIVRGADTEARELTPESWGLYAVASGFRAIARDDHDNMTRQFHVYDALYAYCRARVHGAPP